MNGMNKSARPRKRRNRRTVFTDTEPRATGVASVKRRRKREFRRKFPLHEKVNNFCFNQKLRTELYSVCVCAAVYVFRKKY